MHRKTALNREKNRQLRKWKNTSAKHSESALNALTNAAESILIASAVSLLPVLCSLKYRRKIRRQFPEGFIYCLCMIFYGGGSSFFNIPGTEKNHPRTRTNVLFRDDYIMSFFSCKEGERRIVLFMGQSKASEVIGGWLYTVFRSLTYCPCSSSPI